MIIARVITADEVVACYALTAVERQTTMQAI